MEDPCPRCPSVLGPEDPEQLWGHPCPPRPGHLRVGTRSIVVNSMFL